jgi:hypothetical protein
MMRHKNIYSCFIHRAGGRLYGIAKIGQQEYDYALILYSENPSVANPMRTFHASLAKSGSKTSRAFHASLSDGCTITWSFSRTPSLCHLIFLDVFFEINKHFIRGVSTVKFDDLCETLIPEAAKENNSRISPKTKATRRHLRGRYEF